MALTLDVAVRTLFGTTLPNEAQQVGHSMTFLMRYQLSRQRSPIRIPEAGPPRATSAPSANAATWIRSSIASSKSANRRAPQIGRSDLLSLLMSAMDEDGTQMTPQAAPRRNHDPVSRRP